MKQSVILLLIKGLLFFDTVWLYYSYILCICNGNSGMDQSWINRLLFFSPSVSQRSEDRRSCFLTERPFTFLSTSLLTKATLTRRRCSWSANWFSACTPTLKGVLMRRIRTGTLQTLQRYVQRLIDVVRSSPAQTPNQSP